MIRKLLVICSTASVLLAPAVAGATLYPEQGFPGIQGAARLPGWASCFERHYGQLRNVCSYSPMWVSSWSAQDFLWAPGVGEVVDSSNVVFSIRVYAQSTATGYRVASEALIVDADGWPVGWTGVKTTTGTGWHWMTLGTLNLNLFHSGVVIESTLGINARIGNFSGFTTYGAT